MFYDPIASDAANIQAETLICQKTEEIAKKITSADQSDDFIGNLRDLCLLNKMADSHERKRNE